tara:strand:+ start:494 stop:1402 length:909 start_codon:yes stop_codon:yes gene_type:complete
MFYKKILSCIVTLLALVNIFPEAWSSTPLSNSSKPREYKHWLGDDYARNALLQESWAAGFFFNRYTFKGTERILDIGCGDGKITSKLARFAPQGHVTGIDQSSTMIQKGSASYSSIPNLLFIQKLAQDKSFYEKHRGTFDLVTSFTALHWVKEQKAVLKGVYTALKPQGKIYFRLCSDGEDPVYEIANDLAFHKNYQNNFTEFVDPLNRFSVSDYKRLLYDTGFNVISVIDVEDRDEINNVEDLAKQIKSYLPHYHFLRDHISTDVAENFVKDIVSEYEKRIPKVNNKIILIDHYLEIVAQK